MAPFCLFIAFEPMSFRLNEGFPRQVDTDRYTECTDQRAISNGYYIGRSPSFLILQNMAFDAKYVWNDDSSGDDNLLATLDAWSIGQCNNLQTEERSRKCGVGKELMKLCLGDTAVTEDSTDHWQMMGPSDNVMWKDEQFNNKVGQLCEAINFMQCAPYDNTPKRACKAYIEAAIETGYDMMFIESYRQNTYVVMKTADAEPEFISNPNKFVASRGAVWFFCKCYQERREECHKLVEHGYHPGN